MLKCFLHNINKKFCENIKTAITIPRLSLVQLGPPDLLLKGHLYTSPV